MFLDPGHGPFVGTFPFVRRGLLAGNFVWLSRFESARSSPCVLFCLFVGVYFPVSAYFFSFFLVFSAVGLISDVCVLCVYFLYPSWYLFVYTHAHTHTHTHIHAHTSEVLAPGPHAFVRHAHEQARSHSHERAHSRTRPRART